jgi:hypothetical protein
MKRILPVFGAIALLAAVVIVRAAGYHSRQITVTATANPPVAPGPAARFAGTLKPRTVSFQDSAHFDAKAFSGLRQYLITTFPRISIGGYEQDVRFYQQLLRNPALE